MKDIMEKGCGCMCVCVGLASSLYSTDNEKTPTTLFGR